MEMGKEVLILNLDDVLPNRFQPRIKFNEQSILELAESIREHGVIQPIVVRKIGDKYEIIAGERRYKASVLAGKTTIPAIVTNLDDKNSAEIALIENVQRQDLTPIEEAISYKKILDMGYLNQASLAEKLGKTQSTIANKLRLLNLDDEVQEALLEEKISERHARSLLKLNKEDQIKMLNRILTERMTVRKTDEEIMKLLNATENSDSGDMKEKEPIEILDFETPEALENKVMQDNYNIPNTPIVENKPEEIISQEEEKPQINPGFMDIEKIESQAQDIFSKQPEVAETINKQPEILESTVIEEESVNPMAQPIPPVEEQVVQEEVEPTRPTTGRFFNMFNMNREEETNPNYVNDLEEKEVNMDFVQKNVAPEPQFGFNPFIKEEETPVETISDVEMISSEQPSSFITQPNFNNPDSLNVSINNTQNNSDSESDAFQTMNPYTLTDDAEFEQVDNNEVELPVESAVEMKEPTPTRPMMMNNVELEPVRMEENENIVTADLRTVINTIRDCVSTIEKYGYIVDEEEIDLEDTYQVTIKIEKQ